MLETVALSAVRPSSRTRAATLPLSVGLHVTAAFAALFTSVWVVTFPIHPPDQFSSAPLILTTPIPPPLGSDSAPRSAPAPPKRPVVPSEPTAPAEIPTDIPVLTPDASPVERAGADGVSTSESNEGGDAAGVPWGAEGGLGSAETITPVVDPGVPLHVGGDVKEPLILERVEPVYPQAMVKLKKEGVVVVQCVIDSTGAVRKAEVLRSPHPMFDDAAVQAIRQWRFAPGSLNGRAVDVIFILTINFELK